MSGHLGETAAALADGALGADARDRALAHLAGCEDCRADVDMQRRLKGLLIGLGEPSMSPLMFNRLLDIGGDHHPGDPHGGSGNVVGLPWGQPAPFGQPVFRGQDPGRPLAANFAAGFVAAADSYRAVGAPAASLPWLRALRTTVVGGLAAGAMVVTAAVVLAGGTSGGDPIQPSLGDFSVEHAQTTRDLPGADPVLGAVVSLSAQR
jgi:Putative zinc-finger